MRLAAFVFVILLIGNRAYSQDFELGPYQIDNEIRIKMYGGGLPTITGARKGFEVKVAISRPSSANKRLSLFYPVPTIERIELAEFQNNSFKDLREECYKQLKVVLKDSVKEKGLEWLKSEPGQVEIQRQWSEIQSRLEEEAFELLMPKQKELLLKSVACFELQESAARFLNKPSVLQLVRPTSSQLQGAEDIDIDSKKSLDLILSEFVSDVRLRKAEMFKELQKILKDDQLKSLEQMLGKELGELISELETPVEKNNLPPIKNPGEE